MHRIPVLDEKLLLKQTAEGDERAFEQLFRAYHQELGAYVLRVTKSVALAEEVVQEVFIKIWTKRTQLQEVNNFRSYLFIASRNHTYNVLRQQAREAMKQQTWASDTAQGSDHAAGEDMERYYTLIEEAVKKLPPQQQKVWLLSRREGLKHEEIASRLLLSRETVKRHISLAIGAITRYVQAHAGKMIPVFVILFEDLKK
ncbi:RNA polymerase sigma-70 factor [Chitinophaga sp. MM2321]|uniref:RNA polymerase sigma factor n=1 Tax=Chitinophaga sp. MM2321 TaxID=3137178 RepID=UPI0032D5A736